MKNNLTIFLNIGLLLLTTAAGAKEVVTTFKWSQLLNDASEASLETKPETDNKPFESATFTNQGDGEKTIRLLELKQPGIINSVYALEGKVRYRSLKKTAYLQMWSNIPGEGRFFTRTLGQKGPMAGFQGDSGWRTVILPFYITDSASRPDLITLDLIMPGMGEVSLSSFRLIEYEPTENPLVLISEPGQWWDLQTATWIGALGGSLLGILGGTLGWLSSKGKARMFVLTAMRALIGLGVVSLAFGGIAYATGQPYLVFYPLLLLGLILVLVLGINLRQVKHRYAQLELRKISAQDL